MSLKLEDVSFVYGAGTSSETKALNNVNLEINKGEFVAIIGHTGSGKSTLIQHFNGLEKATSGNVYYDGKNIADKGFDIRGLRCKVGLVFQYPEHQLFEESVIKDVCFGPLNQGCTKEQAIEKAKEALQLVGVREELYEKTPFELSGGQKRRVAIAGVLAMNPEILILDEPTAGLDPEERLNFKKVVREIKKDRCVVLSTHIITDIESLCDKILILSNGTITQFNSCDELANVAKGKVFAVDNTDNIDVPFYSMGMVFIDGKTYEKIICLNKIDALPLAPTVEDGYICFIENLS